MGGMTTGKRKARKGGKAVQGKRYPIEVLTPDEVRALIKSCGLRAATGIRNRALLIMVYRCALRISEALSLKPKDVNTETGKVSILNGKGGKARVVWLDDVGLDKLSLWLRVRKDRGITGRSPLFCTLAGKPIIDAYIRKLMPRLGARAGLCKLDDMGKLVSGKRVHAHGLRHTRAFELAQEGTPVHVIQKMLGHSSLDMTSRYIAHLCPTAVRDAMRSDGWKLDD